MVQLPCRMRTNTLSKPGQAEHASANPRTASCLRRIVNLSVSRRRRFQAVERFRAWERSFAFTGRGGED